MVKSAPTMEFTIWVGLREGYNGPVHTVEEVEQICQDHVNGMGMCVTVTPTTFVYTDGKEPGVAVGLINYPRFPAYHSNYLMQKLIPLAERLAEELGQTRLSIVGPHDTITIGED